MEEWISQLYKSKGNFGKSTLEKRRSSTVAKRRDFRNSILTQLRQIPDNMSPLVHHQEKELASEKCGVEKKSRRLEMLEKWKKEKERKKLEAKQNKKPIFKVCKVDNNDLSKETFNYIKGKEIIKKTLLKTSNITAAVKSVSKNSKPASPSQLSGSKSIKQRKPSTVVSSSSLNILPETRIYKSAVVKNVTRGNNIKTVSKSTTSFAGIRDVPSTSGTSTKTSRSLNNPNNPEMSLRDLQSASNGRGASRKKKIPITYRTVKQDKREDATDITPVVKIKKATTKSTFESSSGNQISSTERTEMNNFQDRREGPTNITPLIKMKKTGNQISSTEQKDMNNFPSSIHTSSSEEEATVVESTKQASVRKSLRNKQQVFPSLQSTALMDTPDNRIASKESRNASSKRKSSRKSFKESVLDISADESDRTISNNDFTVTIKNSETSSDRQEIKSLRINVQRLNFEKLIANRTMAGSAGGEKEDARSSVNISDKNEEQKRGGSPIKGNVEDLLQCSVNLSPMFSANRRMMVSTPFLHDLDETDKRTVDVKSKTSLEKKTETIVRAVTPSTKIRENIDRDELIQQKIIVKKKRTPLKIEDKVNTIILSASGDMLVSDEIVNANGISYESHEIEKKLDANETEKDSSAGAGVVLINVDDSESNAETLTSSRSEKTPKSLRGSLRRLVNADSIKENNLKLDKDSTPSIISRRSIYNTPKAESKPITNEKKMRKSTAKRKIKGSMVIEGPSSECEEFHTPPEDKGHETFRDNVFSTPVLEKQDDKPIVYISPFVTVSRGKSAARKEYHMRKSLDGFNSSLAGSTDPRSPKAAADYFDRIVNRETSEIQSLCDVWQRYKENNELSEDACGVIDMTIGQSNLLISKKFNQFRGLIEKHRNFDVKVKCEDLHGFWDMISKQVTDVEKRFENLEDLKKNNWLDNLPKKKTPKKKASKTRKNKRIKSAPEASNILRETILAARRQKMLQATNSEGDIPIFIASEDSTSSRNILANYSSSNIPHSSTPAKGILKSTSTKSEKRKTVAFNESMFSMREDKENEHTPAFSKRDTPFPSRRSMRISLGRSKLLFD